MISQMKFPQLGRLCLGVGTAFAMSVSCAQAQDVKATLTSLYEAKPVKDVIASLKTDHDRTIDELRTITEIEAPPFKEKTRAEYVLKRFKEVGLTDAALDSVGNVIGIRKGTGNGPTLVVSAHLDTVFPEGTDVKVKEQDGKLFAPGIADDTRGLAVIISWIKALNDHKVETVGDIMFVANVGEEGLGNLLGMKTLFKEHKNIDGMIGIEPGEGDKVLTQGTGSHRYEVSFTGPGGHSFGAFGNVPSAIHAMGRAIGHIGDVQVPADPKTTFTVGTVSGGTSVNTIAGDAKMAVDIRSNETKSLLEAEKNIMAAIEKGVNQENERWRAEDKITFDAKLIGDRPAGTTPTDSVIVSAALQSIALAGGKGQTRAGSTDANVPMSLNIPAIILGAGGKSGGSHSLKEWFDPTDAWKGSQIGFTTVLSMVGVNGVTEPLLKPAAK
ncbi:peptidase M20 [Advenella sp. S44]|uniref:M20/M25/M40 family metallo-hydrolase n=1 Tax=Advenella sp. S44 TaxID=1982755 RepID=UPI000C29BDAA|nr:peptidase M20 [Advenella sp. S44]